MQEGGTDDSERSERGSGFTLSQIVYVSWFIRMSEQCAVAP